MSKSNTLCKVSLVSIVLILFLVSSTALATTENDTGNATIKDNYVSSTALATTEKSASPTITETQITNSGSASDPRIYGDRIVWQDDRNGNYDIYMYDLSTKKETQITTSGSAVNPDIYGDRVVWQDDRNGNSIYMYDISTKKETRITTNGSAYYPAIYKDNIVWEEYPGGSDIYMYDLSTKKETRISTSGFAEIPDIYGNKIVWGDESGTEVYMYDLGTKFDISSVGFARIYGDKLVWDDGRQDNPDADPISNIHMYDLSTSKETQITTGGSAHSPEIYGDRIVWEDYRNGHDNLGWSDIYMYDLATKKETQITTNVSALRPAIYDNRIVWMDSRNGSSDIYMGTISSGETKPKLPVASFSAFPTSGYEPVTVKFTDKSANSPTSWKWSFGDGTYSTQKNPAHKYSKAGKYTVILTASNKAGSNTLKKSSLINIAAPLKAPVAAFSASPRSGKIPLKVQFTDKSTGTPTKWKWSFGDGKYSTTKNPAHTYSKAGKYTVALTASNAAGSNTVKKSGYINVAAPLKTPIAAFSASPRSGKAPLKVQFTDKSSNSPTSWKWSFGDGTYSTTKNPAHTYSKAGKYTVSLTVKNAKGSNTKTVSGYVIVAKK